MKIAKITNWYFILAFAGLFQANSQVHFDTQDALTSDNEIIDCGHLLDGPSSYIKRLENESLDRMFTLTPAQKKNIGENNFEAIQKKNKIIHDFENKAEILQTFETLKGHANSSIDFKLYVIESRDVNAFTMLGGYVYITTGLLSYVESLDELAFILGHEMGHNTNHHMERKIKKIVAASTYFGAIGIDGFTKTAIDLNSKFSAPFDQIDEYEADKYGFEIAKKAGYDIHRFADFFKRMEKNEDTSILRKLNSTHPFSRDRRKCLESYIAQ